MKLENAPKCPECYTPHDPGEEFCSQCGAPLPEENTMQVIDEMDLMEG